MSDEVMKKCREMAAQCWCSVDTEHLEMIPELAERFAKMLYDNSDTAHYWKAQARLATNKVERQAEQIKQLQDEVERIHKLGRERASDIADYRDEIRQLQDEIAELKNNPDDPWNGVLNEEGEL